MKTVSPAADGPESISAASCAPGKCRRPAALLSDVAELAKARLSLLVVFTTLAGFLAGVSGSVDWALLGMTLLGTALSAAGASTLNQWWERDLDARMRRTRGRPLPAGHLHPADALLLGVLFSLSGLALLTLFVNLLTASLAALTIGIYLFIYTPMKTLSPHNTLVGAVPGALPPLLGWTAATEQISLGGLFLFAILWFWQMPHFLAIAWMYREDYERAGFVMLTNVDPDGNLTGRQSVVYGFYLVCLSLLPVLLGWTAPWFAVAALLLSGGLLWGALRFWRERSRPAARRLFLWSILYLPVYLALYVVAVARF
jgi:protoheme IX farnesyltransferase